METLSQLVENWRAMPRNDVLEQQASEDFYKQVIFPQVLERLRQQSHPADEYDLLIGPLGTSPEPLMISISILKPRRVVFLCSSDTEKYIPVILERTGISMEATHKRFIEKHDALPIYEAVHKSYREEGRRLGRPPRTAIDMTGGTKLMGAGCAMAGVYIGADIYYVAGDFDPNYRRPVPGTESLVHFQDPYAEFGDLEADRAMAQFSRHDYGGAAGIFDQLAERVAKPRTFQCLASLSRAYECWDALHFARALEQLQASISLIRKFPRDSSIMQSLPLAVLERQASSLAGLSSAMEGQKLSLGVLKEEPLYCSLLFTILESAHRCEQKGNYDAASLLFYRAIEMMAQRRLSLRNFDTANADFAGISIDPNDLGAINDSLQLGRYAPLEAPLSRKVSLWVGHVLLAWLKDPYAEKLNLGLLNHIVNVRNQGLYAHGFKATDSSTYAKFRSFAEDCLKGLCAAEKWDRQELQERFRFVSLPERVQA